MLSRSVIGFKIIFMKLSILFCDDDFLEDLLSDLDDDLDDHHNDDFLGDLDNFYLSL
jgi:hypothetical protein